MVSAQAEAGLEVTLPIRFFTPADARHDGVEASARLGAVTDDIPKAYEAPDAAALSVGQADFSGGAVAMEIADDGGQRIGHGGMRER